MPAFPFPSFPFSVPSLLFSFPTLSFFAFSLACGRAEPVLEVGVAELEELGFALSGVGAEGRFPGGLRDEVRKLGGDREEIARDGGWDRLVYGGGVFEDEGP